VQVSPTSGTLLPGQTEDLTIIALDSADNVIDTALGNPLGGRTPAWTSGNQTVATVSGIGEVTAVGSGSTTISGTYGQAAPGTYAVTVLAPSVASVGVTPATSSLQVGQQVTLTATPTDGSGNPIPNPTVSWSVSNSKASLSSTSGTSVVVTARDSGAVTVTATSGQQSGTASVAIALVPVDTIVKVGSQGDIDLQARNGRQETRTFRVLAADGSRLPGRAFTVASADPNRVTVAVVGASVTNSSGEGTFEVTAQRQFSRNDRVNITITVEGKTLVWTVVGR
jgi:uncharacterized protein YjdB